MFIYPSEKSTNSAKQPLQLLQLTDFSINRILSENNGKTCNIVKPKTHAFQNVSPSTVLKKASFLPKITSVPLSVPSPPSSNILDLSKSSIAINKQETKLPCQTTSYHQTTHEEFLATAASADATKLCGHIFPQLFSSYVFPSFNITTPPMSDYQKHYFAPHIVNSDNLLTSPFPPLSTTTFSSQSRTICSHSNCLNWSLPSKLKPVLSNPTSSVYTMNTNNFKAKSSPTLNSHSSTISLTTVRNISSNSPKNSSIANSTTTYALVSEEISFKCRVCDKVFGSSQTLEGHERTHKSPRYECTDCGKGFSQLRNYKYHLSVHRGTKEFAAECPECGKTFNDKGYLSSHMKIHRNKKEYECPYCPKSFNQRVAFNMHVRIHTGVKPHKCVECGKRFSRKMLLKQHMRTHSGEKPYQCSVCGKSFADRSNMTLHHRLHSGIKPFHCPICPKAFTKKHHLKTHLNYHTGCKPYVCPHPHCSQAFTQSSNMRTHAKKCQYKPSQLLLPAAVSLDVTTKTAATVTSSSSSRLPNSSTAINTIHIPSFSTIAGIEVLSSSSFIPPAQQALLSTLQKF